MSGAIEYYYYFNIKDGRCKASGNIMSLFNGNDEYNISFDGYTGIFYRLFKDCTLLTTAPELPATNLTDQCYSYMFEGTAISSFPKISATRLLQYSAYGICRNCKNLTSIDLKFTSLTSRSLGEAFNGCTNLHKVKVCFKSWNEGTNYWLHDVSPTGTFICPKELDTSIRDDSHIPSGWTIETF